MPFQNIIGRSIDELRVGECAYFAKTITETDICQFASVTCDFNPAHVDEAYAQKTFFKKRIVHGMLTVSLVSNVISGQLPGPGTIHVSKSVEFLAPVFIQDTIEVTVEVVELDRKKNLMKFRAWGINQNDVKVLRAEGLVMPPIVPIAEKV